MKIKNLAVALGATAAVFSANVVALDKNLTPYQAVSGISGTISSTGSDTLANMMAFWTQEFSNDFYPSVTVQVAAHAFQLFVKRSPLQMSLDSRLQNHRLNGLADKVIATSIQTPSQ